MGSGLANPLGAADLSPLRERSSLKRGTQTVSDFILGGSKITADGDCSHEIKRWLLFGRKVMTNLDSIFKSRDITLPTKVHLVKAVVFPAVMYGCEGPLAPLNHQLPSQDWRIPKLMQHPGVKSWVLKL